MTNLGSNEGPVTEHSNRDLFRIEYSVRDRPVFRVAGKGLAILNLSEGGLCFLDPEASAAVGDAIRGMITLHSGEQVPVEGNVVRIDGPRVALELVRGVSLADILEEQRYLRRTARLDE